MSCHTCAQIHAPLGLFFYTPNELITSTSMLMGDGPSCYAVNPDGDYLISTFLLETWLYTIYTAMMTAILYLVYGKVLLKKFFPTSTLAAPLLP